MTLPRKEEVQRAASVLLLFLLLIPASGFTQGIQEQELTLGVIPFKSPRAIVQLYGPIASQISTTLGLPVQVVTAGSYEQYLQRIYTRRYDIIVLGSTFYFKAHDRAGYQAIARGYPPFHAGIIVLKSSGIKSLTQLRGKSMAAVHSSDRAGYKLQIRALSQNGVNIKQDLSINFRGDFDSVVYAVLSGQDDAGAIRLDTLDRPTFSTVRDKLTVIYTSPENPQFPFAVRPDLPSSLVKKISEALLSITTDLPEHAALLGKLHLQGLERISNDELEELRLTRETESNRRVKLP